MDFQDDAAMNCRVQDTESARKRNEQPLTQPRKELLKESRTQTTCAWKGVASYYTLSVEGKKNVDAVWFYKDPKPAAKEIKGRVAFWKGVQIVKD